MITLEKILTELKAESLNEVIAGKPGKGKGWGKGGNPNGTGSESESISEPSEPSVSTISESTDMDA